MIPRSRRNLFKDQSFGDKEGDNASTNADRCMQELHAKEEGVCFAIVAMPMLQTPYNCIVFLYRCHVDGSLIVFCCCFVISTMHRLQSVYKSLIHERSRLTNPASYLWIQKSNRLENVSPG